MPEKALDIIEGDARYWAYIHSMIVAEAERAKIVACIALTTRHFTVFGRGDRPRLKPVTEEAVAWFGEGPITLAEFQEFLEDQLRQTDAPRFHLYEKAQNANVVRRVGTFYNPALLRWKYKVAVETAPLTQFRVFYTFWDLPDVMDEPTIEREVQRIIQFAQAAGGRVISSILREEIAALQEQPEVESAVDALPLEDIWSGPAQKAPSKPWLN